jgi:coatomer protein complex subunit gamma
MKDMNSKTDLYRANAIRVLCRITDGGLLSQIERYLKQAVVDKNPVVSSAALVSGIHLLQVYIFVYSYIACALCVKAVDRFK